MKKLPFYFITFLITSVSFAQHPGTGEEIAPRHGPSTPDSGAKDTSIMGGGTPGGEGGFETRENKRLREIRQKQEERHRGLKKSKKSREQ